MSSRDPVARYLSQLKPNTRLLFVIGGSILIHLSLGTYHTFGNMLPYMGSYMRNYTDSSITLEKLVWIPTFQGCFPFAMVLGGYLSNRVGPRLTAAFGCFLMSSGVFFSAWTIRYSFWSFLCTYGFMFGLGQGIAYITAISCVINWAPHMVGFGSGIVAAGFGVASSIFTPIQTFIINDKNLAANKDGYFTDKELLERVPSTFIELSIVYAIMQAIGLIVICDPPPDFVRKHLSNSALIDMAWISKRRSQWMGKNGIRASYSNYGYARVPTDQESVDVEYPSTKKQSYTSTRSDSESSDDGITPEPTSLKPSEMLQTTVFYWLFSAMFCCSFYGNFFYNLYKTFGQTFIADDYFLAWAFSIGSIANAMARVGWGLLTDKIGFQFALLLATSSATALLITMPLTFYMGKIAYLLWLTLIFISMGATNALFVTATVRCFGTKHKTVNYGFLILSTTLSGVVLTIGCQYLLQLIGYSWAFILTAAFPFTAALLTAAIRLHKNYIV